VDMWIVDGLVVMQLSKPIILPSQLTSDLNRAAEYDRGRHRSHPAPS